MKGQGISQIHLCLQSRKAGPLNLDMGMQEVCMPFTLLDPVGFPQMGNAAAFTGGLPPGISGTNDRCTILVSNLNPVRVDEDKLFNLFSLYGNIVRIKILRNKPDHALVQMGDGFQAELAVHFLKGAKLFEKHMEVNFSKHPNITTGADTRVLKLKSKPL